jgi:hypothetical protein
LPQELEILKILADFVIFLVSITIPTYAIAISLLGPEYAKTIEKIELEKQKLEKELQEKAGSGPLNLEELEKKIAGFHEKENKLKGRFNPLSLYPTVIFPNVFFGVSLFTLLLGMYDFNIELFPYWLGVSLLFIMLGLVILGKALTMIQKAAKGSV